MGFNHWLTFVQCAGRFFLQQYLQTYSAVSTSNSVSSFCSCWQKPEMPGLEKTKSKPYGRDQYLKLWTRVSFPIIFFLTEEFSIFSFLVFFWHLPCYLAKELLKTQTFTTERKGGREVQISMSMKKKTPPFHKRRGHFYLCFFKKKKTENSWKKNIWSLPNTAKKLLMRKTNQMKYNQRSLNANLAWPLHEKVRSFLKPCLFVEVKSIITPFLEQLFAVLI